MIDVKITKNDSGNYIGIYVSGHSNLAPKGYDIYCAGVSALSQSIAMTLIEKYNYNCDYESSSGLLKCKLIDQPNNITDAIFQVFVTGVEAIAELIDVVNVSYCSRE